MANQREDTPKTGPAPGTPLEDDRRGGDGVQRSPGASARIEPGPEPAKSSREPATDADAEQRGGQPRGDQGQQPMGQFPDTGDLGPDDIVKRRA